VEGFTLSGLSKYFETVGRDNPLAAANSSIVLIFCSVMPCFSHWVSKRFFGATHFSFHA